MNSVDDIHEQPEPIGLPCERVLMVGTHVETMGGISTVVRGYMDTSLFRRFRIVYVDTHRDGKSIAKLYYAAAGLLRVLFELIRGGKPLVHIHLSSRTSFWRKLFVCRMALLFSRPYILHVHGSEFMQFFEDESGPTTQRIIRNTFRSASLVFALSDQWKHQLLQICRDANIEVLPNSVAMPELSLRTRRSAEPSRQTILFLGRLGERKGTFDLIKAFGLVAPRFPRSKLICAGDGSPEPFKRLAESLGIEHRIILPGWLGPEDCAGLMADADIFALPSYAEGLPMALLEAMSWQLAIISSPVGGIPQVLKDGDNGILVAPGDAESLAVALGKLLADSTLRAKLGRAARVTVEREYSIETHIKRLSRIYERFGVNPLPKSAN